MRVEDKREKMVGKIKNSGVGKSVNWSTFQKVSDQERQTTEVITIKWKIEID